MKKTLKSAVAVTFAMVLSFALGTGTLAQAAEKKPKDSKKLTIMEELGRTDGVQALVAAIRFVDEAAVVEEAGVCGVQIGQLLDDKKEKLVLFAPSNGAFEKFLELPEGGFDGMATDAIVLAFPGIFNRLALTAADVCDVLLKHVADTKDAKKLTASRLLLQGGITVVDGALFPIAVGDVGPAVNYEANITERDVFTVNGVIHYIDNVIVEAEEPPGVEPEEICYTVDTCRAPGPSQRDCLTFVAVCDAAGQDQEDCAQGATLICFETELGGPG